MRDAPRSSAADGTESKTHFAPRTYDVHFTDIAPAMDGKLSEGAWASAPFSQSFGDIQGPSMPDPRFRTRMKMMWDESFLYVAAEMEEPHLWGTYDEHDMIVFEEQDFEIFIDPLGDARTYYEIEVNILATIFDLFLPRTYIDGGPADHGWDCDGLVTAIHPTGTINDSSDRDTGWVMEWAIPFSALRPPHAAGAESARGGRPPKPWDLWRVNFSRVQWQLDITSGGYTKRPNTPEDNWTWTPQWVINMHVPQHWGVVRFVP